MQIIFRKGFYSKFHFELRKSYPLACIFAWIILLLLLLFSEFYILLLVRHLFIIFCCTKGTYQVKKSQTKIQEVVLRMYCTNLFIVFADLIFTLHIHYILYYRFSFSLIVLGVLLYQIPERKGRSVGAAACWYMAIDCFLNNHNQWYIILCLPSLSKKETQLQLTKNATGAIFHKLLIPVTSISLVSFQSATVWS
jgi:hypothetical protein